MNPKAAKVQGIPDAPVKQKEDKNKKAKAKAPLDKQDKVQKKKVDFANNIQICVSDLARHYKMKTELQDCPVDCPYIHYKDLPSNLTTALVLEFAKRFAGKLNMTAGQEKYFWQKSKKTKSSNRIQQRVTVHRTMSRIL